MTKSEIKMCLKMSRKRRSLTHLMFVA